MRAPAKLIAILTAFVFCFSLISCSTVAIVITNAPDTATYSPSPTYKMLPDTAKISSLPKDDLETANPEPDDTEDDSYAPEYEVADLAKAGITNAQYFKIHTLLYGALQMNDNDESFGGSPGYFSKSSSISTGELLAFSHYILTDGYEAIGLDESPEDGPIGSDLVKNIIQSAFRVKYAPKNGDIFRDMLVYKNGKFNFDYAEPEYGIDARTYSITRFSSNQLLLKFNIVNVNDVCDLYNGKGQAVIQEDANSLFGYHLVSLKKDKDNRIKFNSATASSSLPSKGSKHSVQKTQSMARIKPHGRHRMPSANQLLFLSIKHRISRV